MIIFSNNTPSKPNMEIVVSITVHDKKVCLSDKLKNSLNIQNPLSLICEPKTLPVPTANTINSGDTVPATTNGATTPAAVIPATVADTIATLSKAVTSHPNNNGGICHLLLKEAINLSVPLSCSTCLKIPPAVMISNIMAIPATASLSHFIAVCIDLPALNPKYQTATSTDNNKAMVGSPVNNIIFFINS